MLIQKYKIINESLQMICTIYKWFFHKAYNLAHNFIHCFKLL